MTMKKVLEDIRELISLAVASLRIKRISIEEKDGTKDIRSSLHIMLQAPTGSLKSTILNYLSSIVPSSMVDDTSLPGMIGTVEQNMVIPGFAWTGRNKLLLFDEFKFKRKEEHGTAYLKLLEDQRYNKRFGRSSLDYPIEKDGDLFLKVSKGEIEIRTRFSAIFATMKRFEFMRGDNFKALVNRTIPYSFSFTMDEMDWILEHTKLFSIKRYEPEKEVTIPWESYQKIKKSVSSIIEKSDYPEFVKNENFPRTVGDAIRIHAIMNNYSGKTLKWIIGSKLHCYFLIGQYFRK